MTKSDLIKEIVNRRESNRHLRRADLSDADLKGAFLGDADLSDANLQGANLEDANLQGANLEDAVLNNTGNSLLMKQQLIERGVIFNSEQYRNFFINETTAN